MNITASSVPIILRGREMNLKPLTDESIQAVTLWVRSLFLITARKSLEDAGEPVGSDVWDSTMRVAMLTAQGLDWFSDPGRRSVLTADGRAKLLYESIKTTEPEANHFKCRQLFNNEDGDLDHRAMYSFWSMFVLINDLYDFEIETTPSGTSRRKFEESRAELYRDLFESHGMTPNEAASHTPEQLKMIIELPPTMRFETEAEYRQHLKASNGRK